MNSFAPSTSILATLFSRKPNNNFPPAARFDAIATVLAATLGVPVDEVAAATSANARRLFRLPDGLGEEAWRR